MSEGMMPGEPVAVPVPPALAETLGYAGDARFVGFFWSPLGDQLVATDGAYTGTGQSWAFLSFRRHPAVASLLEPFDLGSSEEDAMHVLIIDRERRTAAVATTDEARIFLKAQHPVAELTPEEQEAVREHAERLLKEWRERPVDHEAIARRMREQRNRLATMLAYLDQRIPPTPGEGQTP